MERYEVLEDFKDYDGQSFKKGATIRGNLIQIQEHRYNIIADGTVITVVDSSVLSKIKEV